MGKKEDVFQNVHAAVFHTIKVNWGGGGVAGTLSHEKKSEQ